MSAEVLTPRTLGGLRVQAVQDRPSTINMLVYGDPGAGKTVFAGSADEVPELRRVVFIDIEGGTYSLKAFHPDVEVVRVETWLELQEVYDELHRGKHDYQTVVLDSLTEIQKFSMYNIMQDLIRTEPQRDPDIPSMREWGKNIEQIRRFVRGFRDLPVNTIFTALAKADRNPRTGITTKKPYLSGKLADEIAGFLDIVVYAYTKDIDGENKRLMLTGATDEMVAKDRSNKLPLVIENPTMKSVYELINSAEKFSSTMGVITTE